PVAPIAPIAPVAAVAPVDTRAAQAAAFARAKDTVGQVGAGSIAALRSVLGGRGMLGSGNESRGVASVINAGQGQLGDVARSQAVQSADLAQRTAEANYTGQINQRGQDIGLAEANYSGQIGQRGQDLSAASERRRQDLADAESRRTLGFQAYESAQNRRDRLRQSSMDALRSLMAQVAPRY
ncbi:MAG TPA: hypothetical protein VF188_00105, partial [Longimicrobiales bacterium]